MECVKCIGDIFFDTINDKKGMVIAKSKGVDTPFGDCSLIAYIYLEDPKKIIYETSLHDAQFNYILINYKNIAPLSERIKGWVVSKRFLNFF